MFSLYSVTSAGSAIWTETQSTTVTNGIFQVNLGSVTTLPGSIDFNTDNIYLGVKVGADAEMTPRIQFTAVPQAFNSEKLGGLDKTGFIQNTTVQQATSNFNISGAGVIGTTLTTPTLQSAAATALTITGNAASTWSTSAGNITLQAGGGTISLGSTTTLSSTGALTVTGGTTLGLTSTGANAVTLDSGTTGAVNVGTGTGATKTIQIGNNVTTGLVETINIGNTTGTSTAGIIIGSNIGTSITTLNGGTGSGTGDLVLQTAASGIINIGNNAVSGKVVNIGSAGATATTSTVNIATGAAAQTVIIGSSNTTSTTTVQGGDGATGGISLNVTGTNNRGTVVKSTTTNSTAAFQIQDAAGTSNLLVADTANTRLGLGIAPITTAGSGLLQVGAAASTTAAQGISFGGDTVANLYRSAASTLATDGVLQLNTAGTTGNGLRVGVTSAASAILVQQQGGGSQLGGLYQGAYLKSDGTYVATGTSAGLGVRGIEFMNGALAGQGGIRFYADNQSPTAGAAVTPTERARLTGTGHLLLGTPTDGTGLLQLASGTTAANGIGFGTDTNLYRSAAGALKTDGALTVVNDLTVSTNTLRVDTTNNRVGINVTSPVYSLDVTSALTDSVAGRGANVILTNTLTANSSGSTNGIYGLNTSVATAFNQGNYFGGWFESQGNQLSGGTTTKLYGATGSGNVNVGATGTYSDVTGLYGSAQNDGSATASTVRGVRAEAATNSSALTTSAYGSYSHISLTGTGNITNAYGHFSAAPSVTGAGTIATAYGNYIQAQSQAGVTTGYGLYQAGANDLNVFAGKLTVNGSGDATTYGALFKNTTDSGNAFQVQDASGSSAVSVNTLGSPNMIRNGSLEGNANGWVVKGASTSTTLSTAVTAKFGKEVLRTITTAAANDGTTYSVPLVPSTQYTLSMYIRSSAGSFTDITMGRQDVSGTDVDCTTIPSVTTTFTRFTCTFTTGATITDSNIYVKKTGVAAETFYVDGVQLEPGATANAFNSGLSSLQVESGTNAILLNGSNSGELTSWNNAASLSAATYRHTSVVANGYVYVLGGYNGSYQSGVTYAKLNADGSTGAWASTTSLTFLRGYHSSVTANGYIYVIGGFDSSTSRTEVQYAKQNSDGTLGAWATASNGLPIGTRLHTSVVANGYVYVMGGFTSGVWTAAVYHAKLNADGSVGAWVSSNSLPTTRGHHTAVVANGYIYLVGGFDGSVWLATVYSAKLNADGSTGAWVAQSSLPAIRASHTSVVANGYVYVFGGSNGTTDQSTVWYAQLNTGGGLGPWSTNANALPAIREDATSVVANGYVYVLGGRDATTQQSTVWYASTSRVKVGGVLDLVGLSGGSSLAEPGGTGGSGSSGGELIAGNTTVVGSLQVQGDSSFALGVSVGDNLNVGGQGSFGQGIALTGSVNGQNYSVGTIAQTTTTVTGTGTTFTAGMVGGMLYYPDGTSTSVTGFTSATSITVTASKTVAAGSSYNLQWGGLMINGAGTSSLQSNTNSTTAFRIQDASATTLFTADTSGMVIKVSGTTTTFATLVLDNAHFKSTQTTKPTAATPTTCGTGTPTAAVASNSTDNAGSLTITEAASAPGLCSAVFTFNKTFGAAPKSVILTASDANGSTTRAYVSATSATTFTVTFGVALTASQAANFYYWVVE